jgi:hypothetical protein
MQQSHVTSAVRAFGAPGDLEVDFTDASRADLVTELLTRCVAPCDAGFWWAQTLGSRIAALLRLVITTTGRRTAELTSHCIEPSCGATFEIELPLAALAAQPEEGGEIEVALSDGRELALRRPRGEDLRAWRSGVGVQAMLEALCLSGDPRPDDAQDIGDAMNRFDPLVDFSIRCCCPACGAVNGMPVDLELFALRSMRASQQVLLREVHEFARHYGWTEAETLAVPRARRVAYLQFLEGSA